MRKSVALALILEKYSQNSFVVPFENRALYFATALSINFYYHGSCLRLICCVNRSVVIRDPAKHNKVAHGITANAVAAMHTAGSFASGIQTGNNISLRMKKIRNVPLAELMEQISMVFQRVYLFQDTIYNNISIGKPDATEEEVYAAAKKARCYDFIMALPDGFQTVVGEGGATLSGGEKQRISIARCILKDAPIIILDEATASVDTDNESYIQEAISELVKGKTLLVIAHRLNTIQNADQILVIDNGQIAQQGTHEELLKQPGIYQEFVNIRKNAAGWSLA